MKKIIFKGLAILISLLVWCVSIGLYGLIILIQETFFPHILTMELGLAFVMFVLTCILTTNIYENIVYGKEA